MTDQMRAFLYLAFATLAFSSMELAGKFVADELNPLQVTFLRFIIGFILLFPFAIMDKKKRKLTLTIKDLGWLSLLGICNITLAMVLLQNAVTTIPASLAAIIISSNPIFVSIFARLILKEKITPKKLIGLIMGIFGLTLVADIYSVSTINPSGLLSAVGAAFFFGLYTVLCKKVIRSLGGLITNAGSFFIGSMTLLLILLLRNDPVLKGIEKTTILPILYLGFVVTGFAYLTYLKGLSLVDASKGALIFFFKPVVASLLAFLILHETIESHVIIGTLFIIMGSFIMIFNNNHTNNRLLSGGGRE